MLSIYFTYKGFQMGTFLFISWEKKNSLLCKLNLHFKFQDSKNHTFLIKENLINNTDKVIELFLFWIIYSNIFVQFEFLVYSILEKSDLFKLYNTLEISSNVSL